MGQKKWINNDQVQRSHQNNQGNDKDGFFKFIGHGDYYSILNARWKPL